MRRFVGGQGSAGAPLQLILFNLAIQRRAFDAQDGGGLAFFPFGELEGLADVIALDVVERIFFYMPLQHCEARDVQDESVAAYRRLLAEAPEEFREVFAESVQSAEHHRSIMVTFARN